MIICHRRRRRRRRVIIIRTTILHSVGMIAIYVDDIPLHDLVDQCHNRTSQTWEDHLTERKKSIFGMEAHNEIRHTNHTSSYSQTNISSSDAAAVAEKERRERRRRGGTRSPCPGLSSPSC